LQITRVSSLENKPGAPEPASTLSLFEIAEGDWQPLCGFQVCKVLKPGNGTLDSDQ
jgi:hypothetical protein